MAKINAWLLTANQVRLTVASYEIIEVISEPQLIDVSAGPSYCRQLLLWREQLLPLVQVEKLQEDNANNQSQHIIVVAWQNKAGEKLEYGAMALSELPMSITVEDSWYVDELPNNSSPILKKSALSCIQYQVEHIIIPDLKIIFGVKSHG